MVHEKLYENTYVSIAWVNVHITTLFYETELTMGHILWPMTQSKTMTWVDHDILTNHDKLITTVAFSSLQWRAICNSGYGLRSEYFL